MYSPSAGLLAKSDSTCLPRFNSFRLEDRTLIQHFIEQHATSSCEYNFANLFSWQDAYQLSWAIWEGRLLIYDGSSRMSFMPLGPELYPEELMVLSLCLEKVNYGGGFGLVTPEYVEKFPDIHEYYTVKESPESAEYIYDVNHLSELTGKKLHKKKNLVSQFTRYYPDFRVRRLDNDQIRRQAFDFASALMQRRKRRSKTLDQEICAIKASVDNFDALALEGIAITLGDHIAAFSIFSRLSPSTYDIQFEKSDPEFKGAAQVINLETAKYLRDKCRFLNREQDMGIAGLRQAKMSYAPVDLLHFHELSVLNPE